MRHVALLDNAIKMDTPEDVKKILGPNEEVVLCVEQKVYHPKFNIDSVVITNTRIILRQPHTLGIFKDYVDYSYQDIANVILDKGILRSTIRFVLRSGGEPLKLEDLPNDKAEKAYGIISTNLIRFQGGYSPGIQPSGKSARNCPKCGASVPVGQAFCGSCGTKM